MYYQSHSSSSASGGPTNRVEKPRTQGNPVSQLTSSERQRGCGRSGDEDVGIPDCRLSRSSQPGVGQRDARLVNAAEFQKREKSLLAGVTKEVSTDETGLRQNPKGG